MVKIASLGDCDDAGPSEVTLTEGGSVAVTIVLLLKLCRIVAIPGWIVDVLVMTSDDISELGFFFVEDLITMFSLSVVFSSN